MRGACGIREGRHIGSESARTGRRTGKRGGQHTNKKRQPTRGAQTPDDEATGRTETRNVERKRGRLKWGVKRTRQHRKQQKKTSNNTRRNTKKHWVLGKPTKTKKTGAGKTHESTQQNNHAKKTLERSKHKENKKEKTQ